MLLQREVKRENMSEEIQKELKKLAESPTEAEKMEETPAESASS